MTQNIRLTIHVPAVIILSENIIATGCDNTILWRTEWRQNSYSREWPRRMIVVSFYLINWIPCIFYSIWKLGNCVLKLPNCCDIQTGHREACGIAVKSGVALSHVSAIVIVLAKRWCQGESCNQLYIYIALDFLWLNLTSRIHYIGSQTIVNRPSFV